MEIPEHVPSVFDDLTDKAIRDTLAAPQAGGRRTNAVVFRFARHLVGHPRALEYSADDLQSYLGRWYDACAEHIVTPGGESLSWDEAWLYFCDLWDNHRVHAPAGDQWALACAEADRFVRPELEALPPRVQRLGRVLYALALANPQGEFFCSQAQAGSVLRGKDGADAGTRNLGRCGLDKLARLGVIVIKAKATTRKSARYAYLAAVPTEYVGGQEEKAGGEDLVAQEDVPQPAPAGKPPSIAPHDPARQKLIDEWTRGNGGVPPTPEQIEIWIDPPTAEELAED